MRSSSTESIILFIIVCTLLITLLIGFITFIVYKYQQKQNAYYKDIERLKAAHGNELLQSQLEMQEQTFENISREIHDNIGQKLTLAKLHLNTLDLSDANKVAVQLNDAVSMISEAINDLSDISRSMSSEIVMNNGLIKALEFEISQLNKSCLYEIYFEVDGEPVFFESQKELVILRIIQEALNNIIKHAFADRINIELHYCKDSLLLSVSDNGKGFTNGLIDRSGTGISNMRKRAEMLKGVFEIDSKNGQGTSINIKIPIHESKS